MNGQKSAGLVRNNNVVLSNMVSKTPAYLADVAGSTRQSDSVNYSPHTFQKPITLPYLASNFASSDWTAPLGTRSIVLMTVVDSNLKFVAVDVAAYGWQSDGGTFSNSRFG
ncbi:hypothetical protein MRX96_052150 [Rhipicephalus microplus]